MTSSWLRFKRFVYLTHRWLGIGACVLMALWFVSGIVMLFIGYPKFTPWERLARLPALNEAGCRISVAQALAASADASTVSEIVLTTVRGRPVYRLRLQGGAYLVIDAETGRRLQPATAENALESARAYAPGASATYLGMDGEDRWTHSGALDPHRPLHRVQMDDADHTLLYVSSATGEVVMDAPRAQRLWNYAGAWLHWLYMFRDRPVDPAWSWIVIGLSSAGVIASVTGTLAGIWRWRFRGRYKSGSRSPYRNAYLRWHHMAGLAFAAVAFTWIFSGLMSMNPAGIFDPGGGRPNTAAYRGGMPGVIRTPIEARDAIERMRAEGFGPREISWRVLNGEPYLLARDQANHTRLAIAEGGAVRIATRWPRELLIAAASHMLAAPIQDHKLLDRYDAYYYGRAPEAMMGAMERRLPVLRVGFGDTGHTWVYLDPYTGDVALALDRTQRLGRWMFNFLHSWDLPSMLDARIFREIVLIFLGLGGLVLSATGVVIGYARLRIKLSHGSNSA